MASVLMRRSVLTAALVTVATVAAPFAGIADAATFAATGITSTPAPDTSTTPQTVEADRPTITAAFSAPLGAGSTMTLVKKGTATNLCSTSAINGATVACTPDAPLALGQTYDAVGHGVAADGSGSANSATFEFQPSYPSYASSVPVPGGSLIQGDSNNPITIVYNTRKGLDANKSHITVRNFLDGKPGNPISGSSSVSASNPLPGSTVDTISFAPTTPMSPGAEYEVSAHVEETGESTTNPATADTLFDMFVQNAAPSNLATTAPVANNVNDTAFHFTGKAGPGQTVTVTVSGKDATTTLPTTKTGSGTVPSCGQLLCAWDVPVDISGLADTPPNLTWTAQAADGNGVKTTATSGPAFGKDTTAPGKPAPSASFPTSPTVLHVTANNPDSPTTDVAQYIVTITDSASKTLGPKTFTPDGSDNLATDIDVSSLNDGQLVVSVQAADANGNVSAAGTTKPTKNVGNTPDFANSSITVNGNTITLPNADGRTVQSPDVVTIVFQENVKPSWTDSTNPASPKAHPSSLCVSDKVSAGGTNCLNGPTTFPQPNVMQTTIGFNLAETDGYHVFATAWPAAFCSDVSFGGTVNPNCKAFASDITNPATGAPFTFAVDDTPPAAPVINMPSTIDANSVRFVGITGTAEKGSNVVVTVHSSGGGSVFIANPGGTRASSSDGTYSFVADLSHVPDGTLTVNATATDEAGNVSPAGSPSPTPVLQARPSAPQHLGAAAGDRQVVLGWGAPASTGGHPLTQYQLTVTDLNASTAPQTTSLPASATSVTVGGLTNGHTYKFSLAGNNDIGSGAAATTAATPKSNTSLSIAGPSHNAITYGQSFTLHGTLSYFGVGVAGKTVNVTSRYYNGAPGPHWSVQTDQNGNWAVIGVKPPKSITYTASYAGDGTFNPSSRSLGVAVRALVKITKVSARSSSHTSPVTLSGSVAPNFHGYRVYIYEVRSNGSLVKLGSALLSAKSTWSFTHTFSTGKHFVIAKFFGHAGNTTNQTGRVKIVRT